MQAHHRVNLSRRRRTRDVSQYNRARERDKSFARRRRFIHRIPRRYIYMYIYMMLYRVVCGDDGTFRDRYRRRVGGYIIIKGWRKQALGACTALAYVYCRFE